VKKKKDPDERVEFGRHWGDWGGVVMAALFLIAFLVFLFGPNPLQGLDKTDEVLNRIQKEHMDKAIEANRQQAIHDAEASGVVEVGITPAKKH
jgi:hypothetical protein